MEYDMPSTVGPLQVSFLHTGSDLGQTPDFQGLYFLTTMNSLGSRLPKVHLAAVSCRALMRGQEMVWPAVLRDERREDEVSPPCLRGL
jgi:hypothetical protein